MKTHRKQFKIFLKIDLKFYDGCVEGFTIVTKNIISITDALVWDTMHLKFCIEHKLNQSKFLNFWKELGGIQNIQKII